jgi:hypothetical protein
MTKKEVKALIIEAKEVGAFEDSKYSTKDIAVSIIANDYKASKKQLEALENAIKFTANREEALEVLESL